MRKHDLTVFKNWFYTYSNSFLNNDENFNYHIILKRDHCKRVSEEIIQLGKSLGLKKEDLRLAELIGLYHDIGRFEQYSIYKTFSDEKSRDHADLGARVVKNEAVFNDIDYQEKSIIYSSIRMHNKLTLNGNITGKRFFFISLLRDADKLDIWKVLIAHYKSENKHNNPVLLDLPDIPCIAEKVEEAISSKKLVRKEHIKSVNDFIILNMSWIFDLNFPFTFQEVIKRNYISTLSDLLPDTTQTQKITKMVNRYISSHGNPEL